MTFVFVPRDHFIAAAADAATARQFMAPEERPAFSEILDRKAPPLSLSNRQIYMTLCEALNEYASRKTDEPPPVKSRLEIRAALIGMDVLGKYKATHIPAQRKDNVISLFAR